MYLVEEPRNSQQVSSAGYGNVADCEGASGLFAHFGNVLADSNEAKLPSWSEQQNKLDDLTMTESY